VSWGPWSTPVVFCTTPGPPSLPICLRATEISPHTVMLAWGAPIKDNGEPVLEYIIRLRESSNSGAANRKQDQPWLNTSRKFGLISGLPSNEVLVLEVNRLLLLPTECIVNIFVQIFARNVVGEGMPAVLAVRTLPEVSVVIPSLLVKCWVLIFFLLRGEKNKQCGKWILMITVHQYIGTKNYRLKAIIYRLVRF
jgi:hypothetical protein